MNSTIAQTVEFQGSVQMVGSGKDFWSVYPYLEDNSCDAESVTTTIPSGQLAVEGNFSNNAFPAIAHSKTLDLAFWNVCGGIKFFVTRNDIQSVTIKGNNGEILAGRVRIAFNPDSGTPEVVEIIQGETEVTLKESNGGVLKPGKYYYMTLLPTKLSSGITMVFTTESKAGTVIGSNSQTIKRSCFGVLKGIDARVSEWVDLGYPEPEAIDLGLSVKWASFNVGASKPEEYGYYYAWGETEPKEEYTTSTYKWCNGDISYSLTKYNQYSSHGKVDNKTVLDLEDDAARVNLKGSWRMPTRNEMNELYYYCNWEWTKRNGVAGYLITSKEAAYAGRSIFLPASGYRTGTMLAINQASYWCSSLGPTHPEGAYYLFFDYGQNVYVDTQYRTLGLTVRAVCPKN